MGWTRIENKIPEEAGFYLVCDSFLGIVEKVEFDGISRWNWMMVVSHWMNLPKPAKINKNILKYSKLIKSMHNMQIRHENCLKILQDFHNEFPNITPSKPKTRINDLEKKYIDWFLIRKFPICKIGYAIYRSETMVRAYIKTRKVNTNLAV